MRFSRDSRDSREAKAALNLNIFIMRFPWSWLNNMFSARDEKAFYSRAEIVLFAVRKHSAREQKNNELHKQTIHMQCVKH